MNFSVPEERRLIRSIDDVERYSRESARAAPEIADRIELRRPGLSEFEVAGLKRQLPGLPDDYLQIAIIWNLDGISIGYLNLWPGRFGERRPGLSAALLGANSNESPFVGWLRSYQLLHIADFEGDPVCVAAKFTGSAGQVWRFAPVEDPYVRPRLLAKNFGDLLKAATELHAFSMSARGTEGIDDLITALRWCIPGQALDEWRILASMVIG